MPDKLMTEPAAVEPIESPAKQELVALHESRPEPVHVDVVPFAVPVARPMGAYGMPTSSQGGIVLAKREPLALVSLACGLTGIIPIVTQVIGLGTGIASLVRIRRARQRGVELRGTAFAISGIVSSVLVLLGWVAAAAALSPVGESLAGSTSSLLDVLQQVQ